MVRNVIVIYFINRSSTPSQTKSELRILSHAIVHQFMQLM